MTNWYRFAGRLSLRDSVCFNTIFFISILKFYIDTLLIEKGVMKADGRGPQVNYKNYASTDLKYGVELVGWPFPQRQNPGDISSVEKLRILLVALNDETCHWQPIPIEELATRRDELARKQALGLVATRKQRSDFGILRPSSSNISKRKKPVASCKGRAAKRQRISSDPAVDSSESESDSDDLSSNDDNDSDEDDEHND